MNIRNDKAGYVTDAHIIQSGFKAFDNGNYFSDQGMEGRKQVLPEFTDGVLYISGGYWNYEIKNFQGKLLWSGWPNSNQEFDDVISELRNGIAS